MILLIIIILFVLGGAVFIWAHWIEPNWFRLRRKIVRVQKPLKKPLTILHLSDLHFTKERFFPNRFFDRLSRLDLDFVFVTGDLIDGPGGIEPCIANLKKLRAGKGIYAVLGNHDYRIYPVFNQLIRAFSGKDYSTPRPDTEQFKSALVRGGIHLLANENRSVPLDGGEEAIVVGIDDPITGRSDLDRAFHGIEDGTLHLVLAHSPRIFPALGKRTVDIAFAGHTHGGQIRIPGIGAFPIIQRMTRMVDTTDRFGFMGLVSRGMGAQPVIRLRLFCRPEALLVRIEGS